jgi:hypothetical protein
MSVIKALGDFSVVVAVGIVLTMLVMFYGFSIGMASDELLMAVGSFFFIFGQLIVFFVMILVAFIVLDVAVDKTTMWHYLRNDKDWLPVLREAQRIIDERNKDSLKSGKEKK